MDPSPDTAAGARPGGRGVVAAAPSFGGGLIAAAALPPVGAWWSAPVGIALLAGVLLTAPPEHDRSVWARLRAGWFFGLGVFVPGWWWMSEFHIVGAAAAIPAEAAFVGVGVALVPRRSAVAAVAALPSALVLTEWARGHIPFGGVPIGGIPIGLAESPALPVARLGGELLLLGLHAAVGGALALAVWVVARRPPPSRWAAGVAASTVAAALVTVAVGHILPSGHRVGEIDVALVQGGGARGFRAVYSDPSDVFAAQLAASRTIGPGRDLVVWPENGVDTHSIDRASEGEALAHEARRLEATVVAGVTEDDDEQPRHFRNVAVAWSPEGEIVDRHTKVIRVPFGEYVPGRALFEAIADLSVIPRDATAGEGPGVLETPAARLGVSISWETFFARRARGAARAGAELLVVPTNAASFTARQVPAQEVEASRLRAVEQGRWLLQVAPTGYTAVIDPHGRVREIGPLGEATVLEARVGLRRGLTPYGVVGDAPVVVAAAAALVALWWRASAASVQEDARMDQ